MFVEFEMERLQSLYENEVKYNLSDSGNHPLSMNDLMSEEEIKRILEMEIYYGYTTGDPRLLSAIASWYPDKVTSSNILVTNGSAEANFLIGWTLVEPDDEVIMVLPNYMQLPGLAKNLGAKVKTIHLKVSLDWHIVTWMRYIEDQIMMEMNQKVLFTFMINQLSHVVYQNHSRTLD